MTMCKTKLMRRVEAEQKQPVERIVPEMVGEMGLSAAADYLGVSKATLGYWILKMGIRVRRVAPSPGGELEIKRGV